MAKMQTRQLVQGLKGTAGITLIEVLAAMIVLAVGILAMAPMMAISITGSRFSSDVTALASAAQQSIEEQISAGSFPNMPHIVVDTLNDGLYEVATEVRDNTVDASIPNHVYEVNVTVSWKDDKDLDRSMMFTTYGGKP